ncbi:MAG: type II toxin-antitoxin system PemK/MazF family toxin [Nitrococcus sp.]|nr:type II toxin-antitoxin system PemK/MazF family toxin [Nitrococcus sp.]
MSYQAGDIVWARFFADKLRPGVVVGNDRYVRSVVLVCPGTGTLLGGPVRIRLEPEETGLSAATEIMPHRLQSLPPNKLQEVVGRMPAARWEQLEDVLLDLLGLQSACQRLLR